jgi:hypothetical protein
MLRPGLSAATPAEEKQVSDIEAFLLRQLTKESYREQVRGSALQALASLPGIGRGDRPRAVSAMIEWSGRGKSMDARMAAIGALGTVARSAAPSVRSELYDVFSMLADEVNFRTHMALVHALESAELPDGISLLSRIRSLNPDGRVKRAAGGGIDRLQAAGTAPESVQELKSTLEKLAEEHRKLKGVVEELKAAQSNE